MRRAAMTLWAASSLTLRVVVPLLWIVILAACSSPPLGLDEAHVLPPNDATALIFVERATDGDLEIRADVSAARADAAPSVMEAKVDAGVDSSSDAAEASSAADVTDGPSVLGDGREPTDASLDANADGGASDLEAGTADAGNLGIYGPDAGNGDGRCVPVSCGTHSWACWPMPNSQPSLPHPAHYTDMGDYTVRDDVTCLLWEKFPVTSQGYSWSDAQLHCSQGLYQGGTGWRLPTRIELMSLVDYWRGGQPAVARTVFSKILSSPPYWTSSLFPNVASTAYQISLLDGTLRYVDQAGYYMTWCVRGGGESPSLPLAAPPNHYEIRVDEVVDNYTGLVWQRGDSQSLSPGGIDAPMAGTYCKNLTQSGETWRLPSVQELATLVDETRLGQSYAAVDPMAFPGAVAAPYWSTSMLSARTWTLDFSTGLNALDKTVAYARCVH